MDNEPSSPYLNSLRYVLTEGRDRGRTIGFVGSHDGGMERLEELASRLPADHLDALHIGVFMNDPRTRMVEEHRTQVGPIRFKLGRNRPGGNR